VTAEAGFSPRIAISIDKARSSIGFAQVLAFESTSKATHALYSVETSVAAARCIPGQLIRSSYFAAHNLRHEQKAANDLPR
jgi:hypothetical protein